MRNSRGSSITAKTAGFQRAHRRRRRTAEQCRHLAENHSRLGRLRQPHVIAQDFHAAGNQHQQLAGQLALVDHHPACGEVS